MAALKAFWWRHDSGQENFGDALAKDIIKWLTGEEPIWSNEPGKYLTVGTLAAFACPGDTMWGTGYFGIPHPAQLAGVDILAVRGPLTREHFKRLGVECPEIYGDPGLLLPRIYPELKPNPQFPVGLLSHPSEMIGVSRRFRDTKIISPLDAPKKVIEEIMTCKVLLSSSLHGLIAADAFGIPSVYVRFTARSESEFRTIGYHRFKYADYYASVGRECPYPKYVLDPMDIPRVAKTATFIKPRIDLEPLLNAWNVKTVAV